MTRIVVQPADDTGCGMYRLRFAAEVLAAQGCDVVVAGKGEGVSGKLYGDELVSAEAPEGCDVLVVQRPSHVNMVRAIRLLRASGVAVVVDMDDDLTCIHPDNSAYWGYHPKRDPLENWHHVVEACKAATLVTVSTPALVHRFGGHGRVAVLPNCIPEHYLRIPRADASTVGWAGTVYNHPDDVRVASAAFSRLQGIDFVHVGDPHRLRESLGLRTEPHSAGNVAFTDYPAEVARFGIGIAPLASSAFNRAKSWLKPLEYAALGVPWIGSDLPEYRSLRERGCGLLANRTREWLNGVRSLVDSPARRQEMSEAGRAVAAELTVEGNAWRWLEAWERAASLQRGTVRV